jgi:hypothetical protein
MGPGQARMPGKAQAEPGDVSLELGAEVTIVASGRCAISPRIGPLTETEGAGGMPVVSPRQPETCR